MSVFDTCHRNPDNLKYIGDQILNYPIRRRVWRESVDVCDRDMTMDIRLILPGICHMTGHRKRPLHMTGHGKRPVIYLVFGHIYQVLS
jgi:hypothetical protein